MSRCRDGFRGSQSGTHAAVVCAKPGFAFKQRVRRHSKCQRCTAADLSRPHRQNFPTADVVVWAKSKPRGESRCAAELRKVGSDFCQHAMRNQDIDSRNSREIHTEDTVQMLAQIEGRLIAVQLFPANLRRRQWTDFHIDSGVELTQQFLDFNVAFGNRPLEVTIGCQ